MRCARRLWGKRARQREWQDDVTVSYGVLHTPQAYHVAGAEGARWKQMEKEWERPRGARSLAMVVDSFHSMCDGSKNLQVWNLNQLF